MESFFLNATASVHGGVDERELARLGIAPEAVIDFSANQSPLGPSPRVGEALRSAVVDAYPDRDASPLAAALAAHHGLTAEQVVVGNGSTELIRLIAQLALRAEQSALALQPTFGEYAVATQLAGAALVPLPIMPNDTHGVGERFWQELDDLRPRVCWWCAPNNPTGAAPRPEDVARLVTAFPRTLFVLDEAYADLLPAPLWTPELLAYGNLIVLRSMTKAWGMAGLRLGYALGAVSLTTPLRLAKPPWNVNACAQAAGLAALADDAHYARTLALLSEQKAVLYDGLYERGWPTLPSAAAFFLVQVGDAAAIRRALLAHGCLVRDCTSFGLPAYIRISPRRPEENQQLLAAFDHLRPEEGKRR